VLASFLFGAGTSDLPPAPPAPGLPHVKPDGAPPPAAPDAGPAPDGGVPDAGLIPDAGPLPDADLDDALQLGARALPVQR
jgi:hypothetical protein